LASINKKHKTISMFSIPRDLYVKYYDWKEGKINKIYAVTRAKTWKVEDWIEALKYNIELLTKEKVDYYINVDFKWFVKFIDAIGWVEITVPKKFVDKKFPDNNHWYRTFSIKKWTWTFDWETVLSYARSRHSTSDFDRSLRQQKIIKSVKAKLLEWWFFSKLSKAKKSYDVLNKYVYTNIGFTDFIKMFNEIKDSNYTVISSNLNDSCFWWDPLCKKWWFLYTPKREEYGWSSVLLVKGSNIKKVNNYENLEKYLTLVFNRTSIYKENIKMSILNSTKVSFLAWNLWFLLRKYGINIPLEKHSITTLREKSFDKSTINYRKSIKSSETIKFLKENLKEFKFVELENLEYSLESKADIEIIIWKDYKKVFLEIKKFFK
jgi:LCP family protein required for cell wall assembly